MAGWIWWTVGAGLLAASVVGLWAYFRSLGRWKQESPRSPAAVQAEMNLEAESYVTDRL
jgi:hypothetical protein